MLFLHALRSAALALRAFRVGVIRQCARQNCGREGHGAAQIVGLQRFADLVVQLYAAVHRNVFKAHAAPTAHDVMLRAGDLPFAAPLGVLLFSIVDDVGVGVAVE